jgi:outer membrane autotransporter protein
VSAFNGNEFDAATFSALAALPDQASFDAATQTLLPDLTSGAMVQVFESVESVGKIVNTRITNTLGRSATLFEPGTKVAVAQRVASDASVAQDNYFNARPGFWARATYRYGEQSNTSEFGPSTAYDARSYAFAGGYDYAVDKNLLIGLSGSYSNVDIGLERAADDDLELNVFQVSGYAAGRYDQLSVSAQLGYAFGDVEAQRATALGVVTSEYNVSGVNAQLTASYDFLLDDGGYFAPVVGIHVGSYSTDDYVEQGGLNLNVLTESAQFLEAKAGVITGREFDFDNGSVLDVYAHAGYVNDLIGDNASVIAAFGSQSVALQGVEFDDERVELGAGVNLHSDGGFSVGASVDGELAENYLSVAGTIRAKISF